MMQVGIVNDMRLALEVLKRVVAATPGFAVAWTAQDGQAAVEQHRSQPADIVLMDLIMPGMDGVQTTAALMAVRACAILIVTATVTGSRGMVFAAMSKGALDAVNTPDVSSSEGTGELRRKLVTISRLVRQTASPAEQPSARTAQSDAAWRAESPTLPGAGAGGAESPPIIGIGASTGGPQALATILRSLPAEIDAAIVIVQHLDRQFVPGLEQWLMRSCKLPVRMAQQNDLLSRGAVWLAHTDDHLVLRATGGGSVRIRYTEEPRDIPHRPSIDTFFTSMATISSARRLGVLLTGMGRDGAAGLLAMKVSGAMTMAQDQASSVVYGMPRAALEVRAVEESTPLEKMAEQMIAFAGIASECGEMRR